MSVRLTTTESDSTPPQPLSSPPDPSGIRVTEPAAPGIPERDPAQAVAPSEMSIGGHADLGPTAGTDSRRALREARAHRRRVAWMCAAVVALCLALTIVAVTLARYRSAAPSAPIATSTVSVHSIVSRVTPTATALVDRAVRPTAPSRGAPASEGGNP